MTKFVSSPFSVQVAEDKKPTGERRLFPRYSIVGTAEVWEDGYNYSTRGTVTDISMTGCYIQMLNPMPIGQKLRCKLMLGKNSFEGEAKVINQHPNLGMGIDFAETTADQQRSLSACIHYAVEKHTSQLEGVEMPEDKSTVAVSNGRSGLLVSKIQEWFQDHDLMTRDEFRKLIERLSAEEENKFII